MLPRCHSNRVTWKPRLTPSRRRGLPGLLRDPRSSGPPHGHCSLFRFPPRHLFILKMGNRPGEQSGGWPTELLTRGQGALSEQGQEPPPAPLAPGPMCPLGVVRSQNREAPTRDTCGPRRPQLEAPRSAPLRRAGRRDRPSGEALAPGGRPSVLAGIGLDAR